MLSEFESPATAIEPFAFTSAGVAFADDASLIDDDDAARQSIGFFEVMGGEQDGFAARGQ